MTSTITDRFGTSTSLAALLASSLMVVTPQQYGAVGDGVTDDAASIQAAVDYLGSIGGGALLINQTHRITVGVTISANMNITVMFYGEGRLICDFAVATTGLLFTGEWDSYATGAPRIVNPTITLKATSTTGVSTGIRIFYNNCTGGGTNGPVIEGGDIGRESGSVYFLDGISLEGSPHTVLNNVSVTGKTGLSSTKYGAGLRLGNWAQGTSVQDCNFRGFAAGCYDGDASASDPTEYQAEGVRFIANGFQNCDVGVDVNLRDVEVAWQFIGNGFACNIGIRAQNLSGIMVQNNGFQWVNATKDCVSVLVLRDDGGAPAVATTKGIATMVQGNRTMTGGNIDIDVSSIAYGAATTVTYLDSSTSRGISSIYVDPNGYVRVTYTGADIDMKEGGNITISGATTPTQLNGNFRQGDLDTATNTFWLYEAGEPIIIANKVKAVGWAALTGTPTFIRKFSTGTLVNGDVLFMDRISGPTSLDKRPIILADLNTGAKTFRALDYETGLDINSTGFAALTGRGRLTRFGRHVEIQGGGGALISDNRVGSRNVNVYLWPSTKTIHIVDNTLSPTGTYAALGLINHSNYPETINYVNAVPKVTTYATRAELVALGAQGLLGADGEIVFAAGVSYKWEAGARVIDDLWDLVPVGNLLPEHCGADPTGVDSSSAAINMLFAYIRTVSDTAIEAQPYAIDFTGGVWSITTPIDLTNMRTAHNIVIRGGVFNGTCADGHMFDLTGSRWILFDRVHFYGDPTNTPKSAVFCGRLSTGTAADNHSFLFCSSEGEFKVAPYWNYASENNKHIGCLWWNRRKSKSSWSVLYSGYNAITEDGTTHTASSTFQTVATGLRSCLHGHFIGCSFSRVPDYSLVVTAITKANPAVVTYTPGQVAPANGDIVWLDQNIAGMTQVRGKKFTLANVNTGANTAELSGINSTAYSTYTGSSGRMVHETGPMMIVGDCVKVRFENCYGAAYNDYALRLDATGGLAVTSSHFDLHMEGAHKYSNNVVTGNVAQSWYGNVFKDNSPWATESLFGTDSTSVIQSFRNFEIDMGSPEEDWTVGTFSDPARFALQTGKMSSQRSSCLPVDPSAFSTYRVTTFASDGTPQMIEYLDRDTFTDTGSGGTIDAHQGRIISQSLTTAAGGSSTIVVNCASIVNGDGLDFGVIGGTNTGGFPMLKAAVTNGSYTITIFNGGASAFNGTIVIGANVKKYSV